MTWLSRTIKTEWGAIREAEHYRMMRRRIDLFLDNHQYEEAKKLIDLLSEHMAGIQ